MAALSFRPENGRDEGLKRLAAVMGLTFPG